MALDHFFIPKNVSMYVYIYKIKKNENLICYIKKKAYDWYQFDIILNFKFQSFKYGEI